MIRPSQSKAKRIGKLVAEAIATTQTQSKLGFREADIRQEDKWWYVPVWPEKPVAGTYEYYVGLAEVETALQEKHHLSILLIPAEPPSKAKIPPASPKTQRSVRTRHPAKKSSGKPKPLSKGSSR